MLSEVKIQTQIFQWHWNSFPDERGLLCYNLNNSANKIDGNRNKALGLIKGRSDMVYYYQSSAYMIELKNAKGKQSKEQILWQELLESQGFTYVVIRSLEEFKQFKDTTMLKTIKRRSTGSNKAKNKQGYTSRGSMLWLDAYIITLLES